MATEIKKRKVTSKDYDRIEKFIKDEQASREGSKSRKDHSVIWQSVDDQVGMKPPKTAPKTDKSDQDWHAAIQLGALADALEIIAADVLRFAFPIDRKWFVAHTELESELDEDGAQQFNPKKQSVADGVIRSLMVQQHQDFGFRDRVKASIKEGLCHGGFVAEARQQTMTKHIQGGGLQTITAPVWIPHSMWNCFPDPSPSATMDSFYNGSMIIRSYMPRHQFMSNSEFIRKDTVSKEKVKDKDDVLHDVELLTYHGDLNLERSDGDMFLPNFKVVLANGKLVFAKQNSLPYSPIIYTGYEKDDVRDPYFTSPLIKRAPTHKLATELVNKYIDGSELKAGPPGFYDAYDASLVASGGPDVSPNAMTGIKGGGASVKFMDVGDPTHMFNSAQALLADIKQGTSVDSSRAGVSASGDVTATEIRNNSARGEVRTVDFLGVLDRQGLKVFLHMQHDMNRQSLDNYPFFNNQIDTPDFLRFSKKQVDRNIIFEVVGSKQVLGDEQRSQKFIASVQLASSIQPVAESTDWNEVTHEIWNFSGEKNSERFVKQLDDDAIDPAMVQQLQEALQQMQAQMQELSQAVEVDEIEKAQLKAKIEDLESEISIMEEKEQTSTKLLAEEKRILELQHKIELEEAFDEKDHKRMTENRKLDMEDEKLQIEKDKLQLERDKAKFAEDKEDMPRKVKELETTRATIEATSKSEGNTKLVSALEKSDKVLTAQIDKLTKQLDKPRAITITEGKVTATLQ